MSSRRSRNSGQDDDSVTYGWSASERGHEPIPSSGSIRPSVSSRQRSESRRESSEQRSLGRASNMGYDLQGLDDAYFGPVSGGYEGFQTLGEPSAPLTDYSSDRERMRPDTPESYYYPPQPPQSTVSSLPLHMIEPYSRTSSPRRSSSRTSFESVRAGRGSPAPPSVSRPQPRHPSPDPSLSRDSDLAGTGQNFPSQAYRYDQRDAIRESDFQHPQYNARSDYSTRGRRPNGTSPRPRGQHSHSRSVSNSTLSLSPRRSH